MNREEAIQKAEKTLNDPIAKGGGVALLELDHLRVLLEALRGPQPDPDTGLIPCGCGEWVAVSKYPQTLIRAVQYRISCFNCGVETRMFLSKQEAVNAWNKARGYRPNNGQPEEDSCSEKPNDWVSVVDRMPTAEDADEDGMILGRGTRGIGPYHYAAARVIDGSLPEVTFTHWAPLKKEEG